MEIKEPESMTEIYEIRKKLSDRMKNMTEEERVAFIKKGAGELEKKYNLKLPEKIKR